MRNLSALDPGNAPAKSRELLDDILSRRGSAGEMVRTMAHSPALLQGYLDFSRAMKRSKLSRALSEKISLALQEWIGCACWPNLPRSVPTTSPNYVRTAGPTATSPRSSAWSRSTC